MRNLSKLQKEIVKDLNAGASLITSSEATGAVVSYPSSIGAKPDYHINGKTFWNMVMKDVIFQQLEPPFYYVLHPDFKSK